MSDGSERKVRPVVLSAWNSRRGNLATGTYFVRNCPTCGRSLQIRVELLGRDVECVHCGGKFNTSDQVDTPREHRIDQALEKAQRYIDSNAPVDPTAAEPI